MPASSPPRRGYGSTLTGVQQREEQLPVVSHQQKNGTIIGTEENAVHHHDDDDDAIFQDLETAESQATSHHRRRRFWKGGSLGTWTFLLFLVLVVSAMTGYLGQRLPSTLSKTTTTASSKNDAANLLVTVPLLGKSKSSSKSKTSKETEKTLKLQKKEEAKKAKEAAKEAKKLKQEEAKKAKMAAEAAEKLQEQEAKKAKEEEKMKAQEAAKAKKEQQEMATTSLYPGCLKVNVTYVKTLMPWADHEVAAQEQGCHLASVHSLVENSKLATAGLFQLSLGTDIAAHFMTGAVLERDYYLGGYVEDDQSSWAWTDHSVWDYGFNDTTSMTSTPVEGGNSSFTCLKASIDFSELAKPNISYVDHWSPSPDCSTPLPAIYKCCLLPDSAPPSNSPTEAPTPAMTSSPTGQPTDLPTVAPTATPTLTPTDLPTLTPTDLPTVTPTDLPTVTPTDPPTVMPTDPPTVTPTLFPTGRPTRVPTASPTTSTPTLSPTDPPTTAEPTVPPSTPEPTIDAVVHPRASGGKVRKHPTTPPGRR